MNLKSEDISFTKNGIKDLTGELSRPFSRISLIYPNKSFLLEKNRWLSSVTLWESAKSGLRISSKMYNVEKRVEVGSLNFDRVIEADQRDEFFKLPDSFSSGTFLQKIILHESGKRVESGIIISASDDAQILVVPNAMPNMLAIRCTGLDLPFFEPEYSMEEYVIERL